MIMHDEKTQAFVTFGIVCILWTQGDRKHLWQSVLYGEYWQKDIIYEYIDCMDKVFQWKRQPSALSYREFKNCILYSNGSQPVVRGLYKIVSCYVDENSD